ncbi:MAG: bL17 family ribosomal protein [Candidatus Peribacteraceae bacterium]|nr:bL17 family ribosomal protein [Candidatus Peribacteraceae bacterium]
MRHRDARQRLTQKPAHARMLKRNLVTSLLLYESIRTTRSRARVVQSMVDRLVTVAKKRPAHVAIRQINQVVTDKNASRKIMEVLVLRYANRPSGLTSMVPAGARGGDGAQLVDLTLIDAQVGAMEEKSKAKAKPAPSSSSLPSSKTAKAAKKSTPKPKK